MKPVSTISSSIRNIFESSFCKQLPRAKNLLSTQSKSTLTTTNGIKYTVSFASGTILGSLAAFSEYSRTLREERIELRASLADRPKIEIIGAGMSRTGTVSLQIALEKLGIGSIYHSLDMFIDTDSGYCWNKYQNTGEKKYLYAALQGKSGMVDFPAFAAVQGLIKEFPEAKIILTTRDGSEWAKSAQSALFNPDDRTLPANVIVFIGSLLSDKFGIVYIMKDMYKSMVEDGILKGETKDIHKMAEAMQEHNNKIKSLVPQAQLLELPLGAGWEPICKFLGKEIPDEPYPKTNDKDSIRQTVKRILSGKSFDRTGDSYKKNS